MADNERKKRWEDKSKNAKRTQSIQVMQENSGAPPPYSPQPAIWTVPSSSASPVESPNIATTPLENLDFKPSPLELPTHAECITHLKLLHAFAKLRNEVGNQENLFGIAYEKFEDAKEAIDSPVHEAPDHERSGVGPQKVPVVHDLSEEASLAERMREKRWTVFVTQAVDRFAKWWNTLPALSPYRTTDFGPEETHRSPKSFPEKGDGLDDEMIHRLPPLDILMVWHAYMLNPRAYLEDCMRKAKNPAWRTSFPWKLIHDSIDYETSDYNPPQEAKINFIQSLPIPWDWRDDYSLKAFACPKCNANITVSYTRPPVTSSSDTVEIYLSGDTGYAGKAFSEVCYRCGLIITHETLRVGKFLEDASALYLHGFPLPGTILNTKGMPETTDKKKMIGTHDPFFPNRVIEKLDECKPSVLREKVDRLSVQSLKEMYRAATITKDKLVTVNSEQYDSGFCAKESKIAVRKMLSHYWDNSSPFGLDLVGAVIRQGSFVQKMHKIDWLHSPSAVQTMQRLIVKYHRFVRLIADNPQKVAVPTLDVDLAWHTHQLSPKVYYSYTVAETKKFLNHDDKIPESTLNTAFQWTSTAYEKKYGQPYSECACWYCECMREPLRSSFSNRVNPFRSSVDVREVAAKGLPRDPALGPHISAHNALVMEGARSAQQRRQELEMLDLQYAKVCKRYQKKKRESETPSRENDAYIYGAYGYPMYYPVYVPYYADSTCEGNRYSSDNGGGGGGGSCAAGTCSAGASVGNCAGGSGTPGCKASCGGHGDASGGCGTCSSGGDGGGDGGGCGGCGG